MSVLSQGQVQQGRYTSYTEPRCSLDLLLKIKHPKTAQPSPTQPGQPRQSVSWAPSCLPGQARAALGLGGSGLVKPGLGSAGWGLVGRSWAGLGWAGQGLTGLVSAGLGMGCWAGLVGLKWAAGLGWAGLGWAGLD